MTPPADSDRRFVVSSPEEIDFHPPGPVIRRTRFLLRWVLPVSAGVLFGSLVFLVPYGLLVGFDGIAFVWSMVGLAAFTALMLGAIAVGVSPPTIDHGVLIYASRQLVAINRRSSPTSRFLLRDVVDVKVDIRLDTESTGRSEFTVLRQGLYLIFTNDLRIWLDESDFRGSGLEIFEKIARLHGVSYIEETEKRLLGPDRPRFRVFNVQRLDGDVLVFDKAIPTYTLRSWKSDGKTKFMSPQDFLWIESVQTQYAGPCYLLTRSDGIRFLVPNFEVDTLNLRGKTNWRSKFVA